MPNLSAWMEQYAARFQNPGYPNSPAPNLAAGATMGQNGMAAPGSLAANLPNPMAMSAQQPQQPQAQPDQNIGNGEPMGGTEDGAISFQGAFQKLPHKEQAKVIDDLESQVGDINHAYDQMQQQLGQRPDEKLSRHEKGLLIMEAGLRLMKASGADEHGGDIGGAVGDAGLGTLDTYRDMKKQKRADVQQYDTQQRNLALGRIRDVGNVRKDAANLANTDERIAETERHNREMEQAANDRLSNLESWQRTQVEKGIGAGRPAAVGRSGGGAGSGTANQKNIDDLVKRGVPEELAVNLVYRRIQDPRKAWQSLYDARRKTFSSEADAKREADDIISELYGKDAVEKTRAPIIPPAKASPNPVRIASDDEYAKLPSGQVFIGPDGKKRRKP